MIRQTFAVALSVESDPRAAVMEAAAGIKAVLGDRSPSLAALFVSPQLCADPWALSNDIHDALAPERLVGCTTETAIGMGREIEGAPALALWCANLPDVEITTFRLVSEPGVEGDFFAGWPDDMVAWDVATPLVLIADPFTFPTDVLLAEYNGRGLPPIVGGLASGGTRAGEHVLFVDRDVHFDGAVGVALPGAAAVTVVSQGCAPIGPDMVITAGGGPVIAELAGRTAFDKISSVVEDLADTERLLVNQPLLAGLVIDENKPDYDRGDFLVRGIHGRDPETGAIYIGENVRVGQTMRLHVRDGASASEDLKRALHTALTRPGTLRPAGALLFTCNGRGTSMFSQPDHDASVIASEVGVPTAGMFCNGEIGPVAGHTFLHGFTATMVIFMDDPTSAST